MIVVACVLVGCKFDYMDVDTYVASDGEAQVTMSVDIRVSGSMISTRSAASDAQLTVNSYDLLVFSTTSAGTLLEYVQQGVVPTKSEVIPSSGDYLIDTREVSLTAGSKKIVAVANANSGVNYPDLKTIGQSSDAQLSDVTTLDAFSQALRLTLTDAMAAPLLMTGQTTVASASGADVFVRLGRACARLDVDNQTGGKLVIGSVQVKNVARSAWPLVNNFATNRPEFFDYAKADYSTGMSAYLLYSNASTEDGVDYRMNVALEGTLDGITYSSQFVCPSPIYADYNYVMTLTAQNGEVQASFTPDWSSGSFSIVGVHLTENKMTFPFTADGNWGYEITWQTDINGDVKVKKSGSEAWYTVAVEGKLVRVCCTEDNLSGSERSAEFTISLGKKSQIVTITQQTMPTATVTFNGMEWMDRNIGAIRPLDETNVVGSDTYGYYYQWGRNVPFPTFGVVEIVDADASRTAADVNAMKQFIKGGSSRTYDWLLYGAALSDRTTTWRDRTGGADPCPTGYHVPSYREYQTILPYKNSAGIGNFSKIGSAVNANEVYDDSGDVYSSLYVTSDAERATIYAIKKYQTDGAYLLRIQRVAAAAPYLKITRLPGNAQSDFVGEDGVARLASAEAQFAAAKESDMEVLYFAAAGRRTRDMGEVALQATNLISWASTCWDGNSSSPYFDAVGVNTRVYCMANSRAHALPVRCVKDK